MKHKRKMILLAICLGVLLVGVGIYFWMEYQTYTRVEVVRTYENTGFGNTNYEYCEEGILRYSRDGIVLLSETGEEIWNQPCQMSNPIVEQCGSTVAVGDKQGTTIMVFEKTGMKGEIHTTKPIERLAVSEQGIVCAILKDAEMPMVVCYDAMGNVLVEHKVSFSNAGYPMDVSISDDGKCMLVSYMKVQDSKIVGDIAYYYFENEEQYEVSKMSYEDCVIPVVGFLEKDRSFVATEDVIFFYEGLKEPEEITRVELQQEMVGIAYSEDLIAMLLRSEGAAGYKLCIYNAEGKLLSSVDVAKEYSNIKIMAEEVILFDGAQCSIFEKNGLKRYEGEMETELKLMYPLSGIRKYIVVNVNGFQEVRLMK